MPGKFVLTWVQTGYHFVVTASNGETIAQSEVFMTKSGAKIGIESVRKNAVIATLADESGE